MDKFYTHNPFAHGLIESKMWLCDNLKHLPTRNFDNVIILGSWTGTMGLLLHTCRPVTYKQMILVDQDPIATEYSWAILDSIKVPQKLQVLTMDCNHMEYPPGWNLVINCSIDNITRDKWFAKIPVGTTVALQSRNGNYHDNVNPIAGLAELSARFPVGNIQYEGELPFDYGSDASFVRSMIIGIK
jgi:hypothetical protein